MNTVEPIRDLNTVKDIAQYLRKDSERNYVLFAFGIYSGLRISDILKMRVRDVKNKNYIYLREKKTGKEKRFAINDELKSILKKYVANKEEYEYLILSPEGKNKPISRQQAYNILSEAGSEFGLEAIGTHTLRKTWGYHTYQATKDVVAIQEILNHSSPAITLRYIGVNQDNKDKIMRTVSFNI